MWEGVVADARKGGLLCLDLLSAGEAEREAMRIRVGNAVDVAADVLEYVCYRLGKFTIMEET